MFLLDASSQEDVMKLELVLRMWTIPSAKEDIAMVFEDLRKLEAQLDYGPPRTVYEAKGDLSYVKDFDYEDSTSDESDSEGSGSSKSKVEGDDEYCLEYEGSTFPTSGWTILTNDSRPPALEGSVWKDFFVEDYHRVKYQKVTTDAIARNRDRPNFDEARSTAIKKQVIDMMVDRLRPVYIAKHQLQSAGASSTSFHLEYKSVGSRLYLKFRCPHSFRRKKARTFTTGMVDLKNGIGSNIVGARCNCKAGVSKGKCWHSAAMFCVLSENLLTDSPGSSTEGVNKWRKLRHKVDVKLSVRKPMEQLVTECRPGPLKRKTYEYRDVSEEKLFELRQKLVLASLRARKMSALATAYQNEKPGDTRPHKFSYDQLGKGINIEPRMYRTE
jgi:hypothetical protein